MGADQESMDSRVGLIVPGGSGRSRLVISPSPWVGDMFQVSDQRCRACRLERHLRVNCMEMKSLIPNKAFGFSDFLHVTTCTPALSDRAEQLTEMDPPE